MSTYVDFLCEQFGGKNWVLARRTERIVRRYGADVRCLSKKQYAAAERAWRIMYGDPHDKVRAELYQAARAYLTCGGVDETARLKAALEAEAAA